MEASQAPLARAPRRAASRAWLLGAVSALAGAAAVVFAGVAVYLWSTAGRPRGGNNGALVAVAVGATAGVFVSVAVALLGYAVIRSDAP
jgi:hypothetical protein